MITNLLKFLLIEIQSFPSLLIKSYYTTYIDPILIDTQALFSYIFFLENQVFITHR
jgi:hypothetical protein